MGRLSEAWHAAVRRATKVFGGSYGLAPAPRDAMPDEELTVEAGEVTLRVLHWVGEGTPLLLLHGLNNNAWSWARVASQLRGGHRVLAVSLRGHGGSTAPKHGYGLDATTQDLTALLDQLGIARAVVGGHSWGGKVACHFAAASPERVTALLLADPAPPKDLNPVIRSLPWLVHATLRFERRPFPSRASWHHAMRGIGYLRVGDEIDEKLWADSYKQAADGSLSHCLPESAYHEILESSLAQDIRSMLHRIRSPALLMVPTLTLSFLPGELLPLRKALARLDVVRISGDHTFLHTNAFDTAAAIKRFLSSV